MNIKAIVKNINSKTGLGTIYIRVDIYTKELRQQAYFKTTYSVKGNEFSNGILRGRTTQVKHLNNELDYEINKIKELIKQMEKDGINVNKFSLVTARNESKKIESSLLEFLNQYKEWHHSNNKIEIAIKTQTLISHFIGFSKSKLYFSSNVNQNFIDSFVNYMTTNNLHPNTIHRHFKNLRAFFNYLESNHSIQITKGLNYPSEVETEKEFLTKEEIQKIVDYIPTTQRLINVKKLMIIQIYTGLRFSDLRRLNKTHIQNNVIKLRMQKVDDSVIIPIAENLLTVLKSIDYEVKNIIISNQKYNDYIKELAKLAGIVQLVEKKEYSKGIKEFNKIPKCDLLASHNLRTTFVTLAIQSGMNLTMIMKITGHKKLSTLQIYAKSIDQYVTEDYTNFTKYLDAN
jgi:site-specific recombinase XerD